jgi:chromosome segregation ATPase
MKIDTDLWVLGSIAAFLLAAGGAVLRSAFVAAKPPDGKDVRDPNNDAELQGRVAAADATIAELTAQLSAVAQSHEAERAEMLEQQQRAERQVQGAQAEIQRLTHDLEVERVEAAELQKKIKTANDERELARAKVEALERLVEGVRARSRQLSEELKKLKGE